MATTTIQQGEDAKLQVLVTDNAGAAVYVDSTKAAKVMLALRIGSKVYKRYSTDPADNYDAIDVDGSTLNQINLNISSDVTKQMATGGLDADVIAFFNDNDFGDGDRRVPYKFRVATIVKGYSADLD